MASNLTLNNFTAFVQNSAAAAQSACTQLLDFSVGSVLRALMEAQATTALWLQWLILQVLALTRAATSTGSNLDTWMADFSFARLAASPSTGVVTLYRYSSTSTLYIQPGGLLKTSDGTQSFTILADPTNITGNWNSVQQAYQMTIFTSQVNVLVQAVNAGTQGNVQAGAIALIASAINGVDYCSNASAFTNGVNSETDAAFRARFALYINTRSLTTNAAVLYAVYSVEQQLSATIVAGTPQSGQSTVYIDDGSGAVPGSVIASVQAAVNLVRAVGTTIYVLQAPVTNASINIVFTSAAGYVHATQIALVNAAVTALVGGLQVGQTLSYSSLAAAVYGVGGIAATPTLTINSVAADLPPGVSYGVVRLYSLTVA